MSVRRLGASQRWTGLAALGLCVVALGMIAPTRAAAAPLNPTTLCKITGPAPPAPETSLRRSASAAEALVGSEAGAEAAMVQLAVPEATAADVASPRTLAAYCNAAGEAARIARSGSAYQSKTYLLAAARFAGQADAPELEAVAAWRLALAAMSGPSLPATPGALPAPEGCAALADSAALFRPAQPLVRSALACARDRARTAGDARLAALAALRLARLQLTAAAIEPQSATALRGAALAGALDALADAERTPEGAELLARLIETALDAGAGPSPKLDAALARLQDAAATDADARPYALALAGRLAQVRGDGARARALLGQAVFLESQRPEPIRQPTWLLWLAAADPDRGREHVASAYRALEAARPYLPAIDPLTEESTFSLRMRPVFERAVEAELALPDIGGDAVRIARAQEIVETYRQAELQSALGADCVPPREPVRPDELRANEILLYPIVLPDRVELIYARRGADGTTRYQRRAAPIDRDTVVRLVQTLSQQSARGEGGGWRTPAQELYRALIKPIEGELSANSTLVIVPDGPLRAAPFAALVDDDGRFLVTRAAVVVAPALSYSQPGADRGRKPVAVVAASLQKDVVLPAGPYRALDAATEEAEIAANVGGAGARSRVIRDFRKADLEAALEGGRVDVLHIATHAAFNGRSDRSFVVADGEAIPLSELRELIASDRRRGDELSLLVLSACETAVGDDQASMGLAGAAVQAGAQSAIASLWEADDAAALELMTLFYGAYHDGLGKAAALRRAQLAMIERGQGREHPGLWAAFTLLGGWR